MIFTTVELAARIERAELDLARSWAESIGRAQPDCSPFSIEIAGGRALFAGIGSPLNKVAGVGFAGVPDGESLGVMERAFADRGCPIHVEISHLADPEIGRAFARRGYELCGFENVLGLRIGDVDHGATGDEIDVRRCEAGEIDRWVGVLVNGILAPDTGGLPSHESFERAGIETSLRASWSIPDFSHYLAFRSGEPVGAASMRTHEGVCHFCGAATLPEYRRRGVQTALLNARLRDAGKSGCDLGVVTTQPGSKSHQNVQRRGFEILYTRAVFTKTSV